MRSGNMSAENRILIAPLKLCHVEPNSGNECILYDVCNSPAQTRGSVLASGLTMPLATDAALVCSLTFLSG